MNVPHKGVNCSVHAVRAQTLCLSKTLRSSDFGQARLPRRYAKRSPNPPRSISSAGVGHRAFATAK